MINEDLKTFYNPGDVVKVKHDKLENVPVMYVLEKVTRSINNRETGSYETAFIGIKCRWFDKNGCLREAVFSTKDLMHVE